MNNLAVVQLPFLSSRDRDLVKVEYTLLIAPIEREAEALGQKLGRELRWQSPFGDGLHDLGRQKGQPDYFADEAVVEAFASGDCS